MKKNQKPNILFLMCDQLQGKVLQGGSVCKTPNIDRVISKGINFTNAYTPNPVCSPARASLMTGLLPHNHGVVHVIHTIDEDQCCLRTGHPHFAQHLQKAGYRTGYFGKWHVERSNDPANFGWETTGDERIRQLSEQYGSNQNNGFIKAGYNLLPKGYKKSLLYGITNVQPEKRGAGLITQAASEYLKEVMQGGQPWCCFVSTQQPHDPFICSKEYYDMYDLGDIQLAPSHHDELSNRPNLYRKAARPWQNMAEKEIKEAIACYYASITEIDTLFGRLIEQLGDEIDNTIIILTSDHGEALGAHGVFCKNIGAYEEIYNIPLIMHVPDKLQGFTSTAKVGSHDLCPTLLDLTSSEPISNPDSQSFAPIFDDLANEKKYRTGYAEYEGTRVQFTQRVAWMDEWKYVFNGFDFDELYNLQDDPYEMNNRIDDPSCGEQLKKMVAFMWKKIEETGDRTLYNTNYPILRLAPCGPNMSPA